MWISILMISTLEKGLKFLSEVHDIGGWYTEPDRMPRAHTPDRDAASQWMITFYHVAISRGLVTEVTNRSISADMNSICL